MLFIHLEFINSININLELITEILFANTEISFQNYNCFIIQIKKKVSAFRFCTSSATNWF